MIKRSIRQFCLSLCLLGAVTILAFDTAFAQSSPDYHRIEQALETAQIDVPETVLAELKDITLEIKALKVQRSQLRRQKVYDVLQPFRDEDIKKIRPLEEAFYESDAYKDNESQQAQARQKALALLDPYITAPTPAPTPDLKGLAPEEYTRALLKYYKDKYDHQGTPLSAADLAELEDITRSKQPLNTQLLPLLKQERTAESKRVQTEIKELNARQRHIFKPYDRAYRKRERAKHQVLRAFSPPPRAPTRNEKIDRNFERQNKRYTDYGITISDEDVQTIKSLNREVIALREEASRFRFRAAGKEATPAQIQAFKARYETIEQRIKAVTKPYEDQLEAAKQKR